MSDSVPDRPIEPSPQGDDDLPMRHELLSRLSRRKLTVADYIAIFAVAVLAVVTANALPL